MRRIIKYLVRFSIAVFILGLAMATPIHAATGNEMIGVSPASGTVGTTVTVTGTGFATNTTVYIYFDSTQVTYLTLSQTYFTTTFVVPTVSSGVHTVKAQTGSTSLATAPFTIIPSITLSPNSGTAGSAVTVSGTNFTIGEYVTITYDSQVVASSFYISSTSMSKTFSVPNSNPGQHTITATGTSSGSATATFAINSSIGINPASGIVGSAVTVNGSGFASNEAGIKVTFNGNQVGDTKTAAADGSWTLNFNIPSIPGGSYAVDTISTTPVTGQSFKVTPIFNPITPDNGLSDTQVTASGNGFGANEHVTITWDVPSTTFSAIAASDGSWTTTFAVPVAPGGIHNISAAGPTTVASSVQAQSFTVNPQIAINKTSGPAGTAVTVSGSSFAANEKEIQVTFDGNPAGATVQANANGSWIANLVVPPSPGGTHMITAQGKNTDPSSFEGKTFTSVPNLAINKTSGQAGTITTISGSGFAANEDITLTYDETEMGVTATTDENGSWSTDATIPPSSAGPHNIKVKGSVSGENNDILVFKIAGEVSMDPTTGLVGTPVTVTGAGFAANEEITIIYDSTAINTPISADEIGSWSTNITIPPSSAGTHNVKIKGSISGTASASGLSFRVTTSISVIPNTGYVGSSVEVSGNGFAANSALKITYGDIPITNLGSLTTDETGSFSKLIKIPKSIAGTYSIKVTDAQNNTDKADFVIDITPPPVPKPISPTEGEKIGMVGDATPTFEWAKSVVPVGDVTYTLQIDTDSEFSNPLLEVPDLTATKFTLSKIEALHPGEYFWRVKATDEASNESPWSDAVEIQVGSISAGVLILIFVVALVVIALILFFLFIRPALKKRKARQAALNAAQATEIVIPEVVNAEFRTIESEDPAKKRNIPWRLALPQSSPGGRTTKALSREDQARLKVIIDFAKSLPLLEPGNNTRWLVELAENNTQTLACPALYAQILRGEIQLRYEPAWMRHPTFLDLQTLLEGQPIVQDLTSFVEAVNHAVDQAVLLLQDIYKSTNEEISWDILAAGGWEYISAVYTDALSWYQGKYLHDPSDRDYSVKPESISADGRSRFGLCAEPNTACAGLLITTTEENEISKLRALHLKLRRTYRASEKAGDVVNILTQLEVQRARLLNAFSQFSRLNP